MQNVKVEGGGNAIVGNVTQHANVVVSDQKPASAARALGPAGARRRQGAADARPDAQA
ncbi:hypothetical protein ACVIHI_004912 [Bradyrhizobium sp. USDA 4524]|uniref:hypothetical protein n=1 Tax=Bradyrhizobium TaxID=374 RepID=UPI0020A0E9B5|nr:MULTISPECIES: hypothetical protein [Bradyrhizobium]MCP1842170.1 hypothetical protein [Bradyrhizobium sp. USDA 4538]MCP1902734.1 hypothetical protein [Bradyrhizobium sp. USDA 4537]MCP1991609.1 hypothetical protein [Bradyrhizobium sp. USDA 4539]MCP3414197.1 hypothetical protein [Bradyrhizobium brasilense]